MATDKEKIASLFSETSQEPRSSSESSAGAIGFLSAVNNIVTTISMLIVLFGFIYALTEENGWAGLGSFILGLLVVVYWAAGRLVIGLAQDIRAIRLALSPPE
jgi:hypothetical protein